MARRTAQKPKSFVELAKHWAGQHGYQGRRGGWIYSKHDTKPVCHGWRAFAAKFRREILHQTTVELTVSSSFEDLLDAKGNYRPTMRVDLDWRYGPLAVAYNQAQKARGDERRAYTPDLIIEAA